MLKIREMLDIFFGRIPMGEFSSRRLDLMGGVLSFAFAYVIVCVLLTVELLVFSFANWVISKGDLVSLIVTLALIFFGAIILTAILLLVKLVLAYIWGAMHFFVAKYLSNKPESLNDFNSSLIALYASVTLFSGLLALIPVIGWIGAAIVQIYAALLTFKFVKERFNLSDAQAAIVIFAPIDLLLGFLLVVFVILSFALVGSRLI